MTKNQNRTQNPRLSMHMSYTREKSGKNQAQISSFPNIRNTHFRKYTKNTWRDFIIRFHWYKKDASFIIFLNLYHQKRYVWLKLLLIISLNRNSWPIYASLHYHRLYFGHFGPVAIIIFDVIGLKRAENWWKRSTIGFLSNSRYKIAQNVSLNRQIKTFLNGITFRFWSFSSFQSLELSKNSS